MSANGRAERNAGKLVVSQWRASRGPRGQRLGWSAAEAAGLIPMPCRTLMNWRSEGLVLPTVPVEVGIPRPLYCSGDVVAARVIDDLMDTGIPRSIVSTVAAELHRFREQETNGIDLRALATADLVLMIPSHPDLADVASEHFPDEGLTSFHKADQVEELGSLGDLVTVYRLSEVASEILTRVNRWWMRVGVRADRRPVWM